MKSGYLFLLLFLNFSSKAQVPEEAEWRYIDLCTSLRCLSDNSRAKYLDKDGTDLTPEKLVERQIESGDIFRNDAAEGITIQLMGRQDSLILGQLINGTRDTLYVPIMAMRFALFETQVKYKGKWVPYQIYRPASCEINIGKGRIPSQFACSLKIDITTFGAIKLPFRLRMQLNNKYYYSNEVIISCNKQQYKMIPKKIAEYTF